MEGKCLEALRGTVRARSELERAERDAAVSRFHFMRLYNAKKFKLDEETLLSSHRADNEFALNLSMQRTRRQRAIDGATLTSRRE